MHVIVCSSESEISMETQRRFTVSALLAICDKITASGALDENTETDLRAVVARTRATFKFPSRQYQAELNVVAVQMAAE